MSVCPAGPGPAKDQNLVRLQQRRVSLILFFIMSSIAAVTIIITLTLLCFINVRHKLRYDTVHFICSDWRLLCWLISALSASGPPSRTDRSQDGLLLLGVLLSSSSIMISGLDEASLSHWMLELLCSVSSTPWR